MANRKFDPERKRLRRLDLYEGAAGAGAVGAAGMGARRVVQRGRVVDYSGPAREVPKNIKGIATNSAKGVKYAVRGRKGRTLVSLKRVGYNAKALGANARTAAGIVPGRVFAASALLGAAAAGVHNYKRSEHTQPWGEYKVYGQRPSPTVKKKP